MSNIHIGLIPSQMEEENKKNINVYRFDTISNGLVSNLYELIFYLFSSFSSLFLISLIFLPHAHEPS